MKKDKKIIIEVRAIILHEGKLLERSNEFQVLVARGACALVHLIFEISSRKG